MVYLYQNPETGETKEIIQHHSEQHTYEENGLKWERVWSKETLPYANIDTKIDPYSSKDFIKVTSKGKDSIGSLWDRAGELSEKRKAKDGKDFVKEKMYSDYSKRTNGRLHSEQRKEKLEKLQNTPVKLKLK